MDADTSGALDSDELAAFFEHLGLRIANNVCCGAQQNELLS
jgi:hypothetical protein